MRMSSVSLRPAVAVVTAAQLVLTSMAPMFRVQAASAARPAQEAPVGGAEDVEVDLGWPRHYETATGGALIVYQPQVTTWIGQRDLTALAAVSYLPPGATETDLGIITLESRTRVSVEERLVDFSDFAITESNFRTLDRDELRTVVSELNDALPMEERVIALDRVLENIDTSQVTANGREDVRAEPPVIFSATGPALLVTVDGAPIWAPIENVDLQFAVNTNWDLLQPGDGSALFLRRDQYWLTAPALDGPWAPVDELPDSFSFLPQDENWAETLEHVPGRSIDGDDMPLVFTSTEPAELISMDGPLAYEPVEGTNLLWVSNTESDLFRLGDTGDFYYLVAGRWFRAPALAGPWEFASTTLPDDFRAIPVEHERSRVLAAVPGSDQANEAILLAQVPRTARVNRNEIEAPEVVYQGDPEFQPIEETTVERAVNTDKDVIKAGDLYYMCFQAVWFMSTSPTGPWEVATTVPEAVYDIPASSAAHHVTYVTVEESSNDEWVTFAYVAGYMGLMIAWGAVVWGSGWYYPPYVWYGPYYPVYYRYPVTYGMGAWYNPWTGAYGRGGRVYGPYGGAGWGAAYNPRTGTYARGAAAYGPYNARGAAQAWNPRTGTYAQTRQGANVYGSWGSTSVQRGDDWVNTRRVTNNVTDTTTRVTRTDDGAAITRRGDDGFVGAGSGGNVYAGRDGDVYRREDGTWQKYDDGGWSNVDTTQAQERAQEAQAARGGERAQSAVTTETQRQLDRDSMSRDSGRTRTRDFSNYRRSGGSRGFAGSYRGGGGFRGGGRRR